MPDLPAGSIFADHEILSVAGRGGMAVVYRARHAPLKREVALKVIAPEYSSDPEFRTRFQRECEAAASVQHPNVVAVYHAGEEDGALYVTMRFVEGTDLAHVLADEGSVTPARAVELVEQVAAGLDAAHRRGLVHRDVKPGNVLIDASGLALLADFGVHKDLRADNSHTVAGGFVGTFDYAAPEQFKSEPADARTDVYALGGVLFHMLTGRPPFPGDNNAAKMFGHVELPPPSVSEIVPAVPARLAQVVARAMAKRPDERYASAGAMAEAARAALAAAPVAPAAQEISPLAPPAALLVESGRGVFVGREDELKRLKRRFTGAQRGERQFVVVSGEPGIGKSRLAVEFATFAHGEGASVLYGRSDPESLVPYQPFIAALQQRVALGVPFPPELQPELNELGRFIPALRVGHQEPVGDDPETRRFRLFEAVTRVLAYAARRYPLVLILDDLHWADASTILLLSHLLNDAEPVRLLVLATMRDVGEDGGDALPELLSRQRRLPAFERIALAGLDDGETRALVAAHDGSASDSFIGRLREQTAGNPFFLGELLREPAAVGVPEGVKSMIARRLSVLDETANQVLTLAAVVGREFRLEILEELLDEPADEIIDALERATTAGLVREAEGEVDRFVFAHALVRETLYERQSAARLVRVHFRIAVALEGEGANPAEVAHHYFESRHLDREGKAIDYAEQAGIAAAGALAYEEAVGHLRHALETLEARPDAEPGRITELLLELGDAESRAGDPAARETFARAAVQAQIAGRSDQLARAEAAELLRRSEGNDQLARAALGFAGRFGGAGPIDREAIGLMEEALEAVGDQESALVATLLARLANSLPPIPRTIELSGRALEMARRVGDAKVLVAALESRHTTLLHPEFQDERLKLGAELVALAQREGDREVEALAQHLRIRDLLEAADFAGARAGHVALRALAAGLGPLYQHFAAVWDALWALADARLEDVERLGKIALELGQRAGIRSSYVVWMSQWMTLHGYMDLTPEFMAKVEQHVERFPPLRVWRARLAVFYLWNGQRERGAELLAELAAKDFKDLPREMLWMTTLCTCAEGYAELGDARCGALIYELLLPYRDRNVQSGSAWAAGSCERFIGLAAFAQGDHDRAVEHLHIALERNTRWDVRNTLPLVRADLARVLAARGDVERSREQWRALIPEAGALGMAPLVREAQNGLLDPVVDG